MSFEKELAGLINKYSQENGSDTPDFLLAEYLTGTLKVYNTTVKAREKWYGRAPEAVGGSGDVPVDPAWETPSEPATPPELTWEAPSSPPEHEVDAAVITPAVPHDKLISSHRVVPANESEGVKEHYLLNLLTPDYKPTAPGIVFHKGSPVEGWHGWTTAHVISGLLLHMRYHQSTKFACDQNVEVIEHLEAARQATHKRADDRKSRGVLYNSEKP